MKKKVLECSQNLPIWSHFFRLVLKPFIHIPLDNFLLYCHFLILTIFLLIITY